MSQVEIYATQEGQVVGSDISGTTVYIEINQTGNYSRMFDVSNTSGLSQNLAIKRVRVTVNPTWTDNLSWAPNPDPDFQGLCYSANVMDMNSWTTPNIVTLPNQGHANLTVFYDAESLEEGIYRYFVMNGSSAVDSVDVHLTSNLGIQQEEKSLEMSVYPNPANNYFTITTTGIDPFCDMQITDALGKVVYSDEIETSKKLDVNHFKNGVYLVSVMNEGQHTRTRRIVVQH